MVAARLQRYIGCCAFGLLTGLFEGNCFRVRSPSWLRPATPNHPVIQVRSDENAADGRIGMGRSQPSPRQAQGDLHKSPVKRISFRCHQSAR